MAEGRPLRFVAMRPPLPVADALAAVTHPNPYPFYAALVRARPLYRDTGLGLWVASGAQAVTSTLQSPLCRVRPRAEPVPAHLLPGASRRLFGRLLRMTDGERHAPLRHAVASTLASVDASHALAVSRASALALERTTLHRADVRGVRDFVVQLPLHVLGTLLGLSETRFLFLLRAVEDYVGAFAPGPSVERLAGASTSAAALLELLGAEVARARGDGLLGRLAAEVSGTGPEWREVVVANAVGFLTQAHEATCGLLGNALLVLAERPALRRTLREAPELLEAALAEVLRYDAPVQNTRRFVAEDGVVAGEPMREGDAILVVLAAANRDPTANPRPHRFELHRPARRTFGFGRGLHECPGQALSVAIARAGVERILSTGVQLSLLHKDVRRRPSFNLRIPAFEEGQ